MSLKRDEWLMMWESIKTIEYEARLLRENDVFNLERQKVILKRVRWIKSKIQSVIGQMENPNTIKN